jgi:hypothetical protein
MLDAGDSDRERLTNLINLEAEQSSRGRQVEHRQTTTAASRKKDMAQSKWLMLALASGTFAAMNGLFAKLCARIRSTLFFAFALLMVARSQ